MKIEQEKLFSPITITLESREEAAAVRIALGATSEYAYVILGVDETGRYMDYVQELFRKLQELKG